MKNKYMAYAYLSMKTLISNKAIVFGFLFNLLIALIATLYLIIFQPNITFLTISSDFSYNFSNSLGMLNIIVIIVVFFLFSSVAAMMQSVIDDRDSKVSEIINTSISEKHYLFGKLVTSFILILVTVLSVFVAIIIASIVFSVFNPYDFGIYSDIVRPLITTLDVDTSLVLLGCLGICVLMIVTSILFALSISIKANSIVDAFPVSILVFAPYFLVFGLLIFLPTDSVELWSMIAATGSFIPVFSPIFILMYVLLNGFTIITYLAIIISVIYLLLLFKGVVNIYSYAFYVSEKLSLKKLLRLSVKGSV